MSMGKYLQCLCSTNWWNLGSKRRNQSLDLTDASSVQLSTCASQTVRLETRCAYKSLLNPAEFELSKLDFMTPFLNEKHSEPHHPTFLTCLIPSPSFSVSLSLWIIRKDAKTRDRLSRGFRKPSRFLRKKWSMTLTAAPRDPQMLDPLPSYSFTTVRPSGVQHLCPFSFGHQRLHPGYVRTLTLKWHRGPLCPLRRSVKSHSWWGKMMQDTQHVPGLLLCLLSLSRLTGDLQTTSFSPRTLHLSISSPRWSTVIWDQ